MATLNPAYLHELAREILGASVDSLNDDGITPPDRRYVHPGSNFDVADDCDQLVVSMERVYSGVPGEPFEARNEILGNPRSAQFSVRIVTCVNTVDSQGRAPSDDEIDADALVTYSLVWSIYQGLLERIGDERLLGACQHVIVGDATPIGPEGGMGGWFITLDVQLEES